MHYDDATAFHQWLWPSESLCYHSKWLTTSGGCSSSPYQCLLLSSLHPEVTLLVEGLNAGVLLPCCVALLWPYYYVIIKITDLLKAIKKRQQSAEYHDHTVRMWGHDASLFVLVMLLYKCWKGESVNSGILQRRGGVHIDCSLWVLPEPS